MSRPSQARLYNTTRLASGRIRVILGDHAGNLRVPPRENATFNDPIGMNLLYARVVDGVDGGNQATGGSVIEVEDSATHKAEYGQWVLCRWNGTRWQIEGLSTSDYISAGINPQWERQADSATNIYQHNIWDGRFYPNLDSDQAYTTHLRREPGLRLLIDGTLKQVALGESTKLDLSAYIPSAGNECFVLIYDDYDGTVGVVQTDDSASATGIPTMTDLQTLVDRLPHQLCMPAEVWYLANNDTTIDQTLWRVDMRQMVNAPMPYGLPKDYVRNWIFPSNYRAIVAGEETIANDVQILFDDDCEIVYI